MHAQQLPREPQVFRLRFGLVFEQLQNLPVGLVSALRDFKLASKILFDQRRRNTQQIIIGLTRVIDDLLAND